MRHLIGTSVLLAGLLPGTVLLADGAGAAGATMCQGEAATVVGAGEYEIKGTSGDDVIVSNGSDVRAGAGDDLICVTARPGRQDTAQAVFAGDGDDSVVVKTGKLERYAGNNVDLGDGDDTFVGGDGVDRVSEQTGDGTDVIDTRGGSDGVDLSTRQGLMNDEVHLGADGGYVYGFATGMEEGAVLDGGDGGYLSLFVPDGAWTVDNQAQQASVDGESRFAWTGFTGFSWDTDGTVAFVGSGQDEEVEGRLVSADMGGGDDEVVANSRVADDTGAPAVLKGGRGTDRVTVVRGSKGKSGDLVVDVPAQQARNGLDAVLADLAAFEEYGANSSAADVTVLGTGSPDVLRGYGCELTIRGGRGDDRISSVRRLAEDYECRKIQQPALLVGGTGDDTFAGRATPMLVKGGGGDDVVRGGYRDDVLHGNAGDDVLLGSKKKDVAYGGTGRDRCVAERRVACER